MRLCRRSFLLFILWDFILFAVIFMVLRLALKGFTEYFLIISAAVSLGIFLGVFIFSLVIFLTFSARLEKDILFITEGFLLYRQKILRLSSAVSVRTFTTPLMRRFSLNICLIIFEGSICILPPVSAEFSSSILDNIEKAQNEKI